MSRNTIRPSHHGHAETRGRKAWVDAKAAARRSPKVVREHASHMERPAWFEARVAWYAERVEVLDAIEAAEDRRPSLFDAAPPPHCCPPEERRAAA